MIRDSDESGGSGGGGGDDGSGSGGGSGGGEDASDGTEFTVHYQVRGREVTDQQVSSFARHFIPQLNHLHLTYLSQLGFSTGFDLPEYLPLRPRSALMTKLGDLAKLLVVDAAHWYVWVRMRVCVRAHGCVWTFRFFVPGPNPKPDPDAAHGP